MFNDAHANTFMQLLYFGALKALSVEETLLNCLLSPPVEKAEKMRCRYGSQRQNKPVQGAGTGRKGQLEASCCKIFRILSLFFNLLTS